MTAGELRQLGEELRLLAEGSASPPAKPAECRVSVPEARRRGAQARAGERPRGEPEPAAPAAARQPSRPPASLPDPAWDLADDRDPRSSGPSGRAPPSCTVTFSTAYASAPACTVSGDNTAVTYVATTSASVLTITSSADMASDVISYICIGHT